MDLSWVVSYSLNNTWTIFGSFMAILFVSWLVRTLFDQMFNPIPSPFPFPLVHHFPYAVLYMKRYGFMALLDHWSEKYRHAGAFRFNFLLGDCIAVLDKDFAKHLLMANSSKYARQYPSMKNGFPSMRGGVFTANGKEHTRQKKQFNPIFTKEGINAFNEFFNTYADQLVKSWSSCDFEVNVLKDLDAFSLDILGESVFGYQFKALESGQSTITTAFDKIMKGRVDLAVQVIASYIPFIRYIPFTSVKESDDAMDITNKTVKEIVEKYRERMSYDFCNGDKNLMAKMLAAKDEDEKPFLSDRLVTANIFTFLIAGHESTAAALMWTLYCLAKNPEIQEKARKEIRSVISSSETFITDEHCSQMPYLFAIINETMRLYPVAPVLMRRALEDDVYNGKKIKKGQTFAVLTYQLHVDPEFWDNPREFRPERFLEEADEKSHRDFTFLPFAAGSRLCIGKRFALFEMQVTLSKLLHDLQFSLTEDIPFKRTLMITMKTDPYIKLKISKAP